MTPTVLSIVIVSSGLLQWCVAQGQSSIGDRRCMLMLFRGSVSEGLLIRCRDIEVLLSVDRAQGADDDGLLAADAGQTRECRARRFVLMPSSEVQS